MSSNKKTHESAAARDWAAKLLLHIAVLQPLNNLSVWQLTTQHEEQLLGLETHQVHNAKAMCGCSDVGNAREELHGALRDWKCKGRRPLDFSKVNRVVT
jgi:hypothetical protein